MKNSAHADKATTEKKSLRTRLDDVRRFIIELPKTIRKIRCVIRDDAKTIRDSRMRKSVLAVVLPVLLMSLAGTFSLDVSAASNKKAATIDEIPLDGWMFPVLISEGEFRINSGYNLGDDFPALTASRDKSIGELYPNSVKHAGVDISHGGKTFTVVAAREGTVIEAVKTGAHGKDPACRVVIEHTLPNGKVCYSRYVHLRSGSVCVSKGDKVKAGQKLGMAGNTGKASTGIHLHLQLSTIPTASDKLPEHHINVNPKETLGIKTGYSTFSFNGKKYTKTQCYNELYGNSVINYRLDPDEATFDVGVNKCLPTGCYRYIKSTVTSRKYPREGSEKGQKFNKGEYVYVEAAGFNRAGNLWYRVKSSQNSSEYVYIYSSYVGDVVSAGSLKKPVLVSDPKPGANRYIEVQFKAAAPKGFQYLLVFDNGKTKKAVCTSSNLVRYQVPSKGYWKISIYTELPESNIKTSPVNYSVNVIR